MEFEIVGGHSYCKELLSDGVIIDVGCRAFTLEEHFVGKTVYSIDPDEDVFKGREMKPTYLQVAISDKSGETTYYKNGEATMIRAIDPDPTFSRIDEKYCNTCRTITMDELYAFTGTNVDLLKLDCEGAEYIILGETFKPIPKQISCEMHFHCVPELHNKHFETIKKRLSEHYQIFNDIPEPRHGCGENWWDILWIRKDLVK